MTDYRGHSDKDKPVNPDIPKKALEKVVKGEVIKKKEPLGTRAKRILFGGDFTTAKQYVLADVVLPAIRNLVWDILTRGGDQIIFGQDRRRQRPPTYSGRVQYNNPIHRQERGYLPDRPVQNFRRMDTDLDVLDEIIIPDRGDAETVIERLTDVVNMYQVVSVADLYELLGLQSSHIHHKWGWTSLPNISIRQVRDGWQITLPPLEEI